MHGATCHLEVHVDGRWQTAADVRVVDVEGGVRSPARFDYDFDYLDTHAAFLGTSGVHAVSCRYPLSYEHVAEDVWPAFLLDLIPTGAARRFWERELGLPNTPRSDWSLLTRGAGNPPGNVRVAEAAHSMGVDVAAPHAGFAREEILDRAIDFIEHARRFGASVAGGSGAGGDSPKFLLREDLDGRFHADGALRDARTRRAWLVKFPRSPHAMDRLVLEAEAAYYRVAARMGIRTAGPLTWEKDALFVPRFDRVVSEGESVSHLGFESLCSLAGVTDFGTPIPKVDLACALTRHVALPEVELREFITRDVLDIALGNTDNHARNTALLKGLDGSLALSPLFDFAPMALDPQGIARVCRWPHEDGGIPNWNDVARTLESRGQPAALLRTHLGSLAETVLDLPRIMADERVPQLVIETFADRTQRVAASLALVKP